MTALILGVGFGVFLLIGIWLIALVACFISAHTQRNIGLYAVLLAASFTLVIIFIPRESGKSGEAEDKVYDTLFFWRIALLLLLVLSAVGGAAFFLLNHLMEARVAKPIKRWTL